MVTAYRHNESSVSAYRDCLCPKVTSKNPKVMRHESRSAEPGSVVRPCCVDLRTMVGEMRVAGGGVEVTVLVDKRLEPIEEVEAPLRVCATGDTAAGHVDVHGGGVGKHGGVERVRMRAA